MSKESDLTDALERLDAEAKKAKNKLGDFNNRVDENLSQVRGPGQWKMKGRSPHFLYNVIGENIDNKVGKLSEVQARARVLPLKNGLSGVADILKKSTDYIWTESHMLSKLERVAMFGGIMGAGCVQTVFNPSLRYGEGDVDIVIRDPRLVIVDPLVVDPSEISEKAEYVGINEMLPLSIIRSLYGVRGAEVVADNRYSAYQESDKTAAGRVKTAAENVVGKRTPGSGLAIPRACLTTYWVKDRRKSAKDNGQYPILPGITQVCPGDGMPFPAGRRIVVGRTKKSLIVLEDTYNEYWDGKWDLDVISWNIDIESIWGADDVQRQIKLQEAINRAGDAYIGNILKNAIIRWLITRGAMDPTEAKKFAEDGAEIVWVNPGREAKQEVPQPLPAEVLNLIPMLIDLTKRNIGVLDPQIQKQMPSIVTGPAIEGLQLAVEGSIRSAARKMEELVQRIGQKLISRIFQYYTSDRIFHFVGDTGEWREFEFERSKLLMTVNRETGKPEPRTIAELQKAHQDFRFAVEPGSSLAVTKIQRAMMKFELFKVGGMRLTKIMEELGIENGEEEMQKAKEERDKYGLGMDQGDNRKKQGSLGGSAL